MALLGGRIINILIERLVRKMFFIKNRKKKFLKVASTVA